MSIINKAILPTVQQYGLALHTSSAQLGLSIMNFSGEERTQTWDLDRALSTYLHQYLQDFLVPQTWSDLAFIAVAKGPGSFTSSRIGVVTARTLSQQLMIPLFAISTLAAFAWSKQASLATNISMAIEMPANRSLIYGGIYQNSSENTEDFIYRPDELMTPVAWTAILDTLPHPWEKFTVPAYLGYTANSLLQIAHLQYQQGDRPQWQDARPFYGKQPYS